MSVTTLKRLLDTVMEGKAKHGVFKTKLDAQMKSASGRKEVERWCNTEAGETQGTGNGTRVHAIVSTLGNNCKPRWQYTSGKTKTEFVFTEGTFKDKPVYEYNYKFKKKDGDAKPGAVGAKKIDPTQARTSLESYFNGKSLVFLLALKNGSSMASVLNSVIKTKQQA